MCQDPTVTEIPKPQKGLACLSNSHTLGFIRGVQGLKYGDDGKAEITKLVAYHIANLTPTDDLDIKYTGCDITDDRLFS